MALLCRSIYSIGLIIVSLCGLSVAIADEPALAVAPFDEKQAQEYQSAWAKQLKTELVAKNTVGMELVLVPPGTFQMGTKDNETEEKQHQVKITKAFHLGKTEVTQAQWKKIMQTEPWKIEKFVQRGDDFPASNVSWDDVEKFCKTLSKKEGKTYRLPTEAEWEYACRAGSQSTYCFGDDEKKLTDYGWFGGMNDLSKANKGEKVKADLFARKVASKKPNAFGLYDMHGNVWEWCQDQYDTEYYAKSPILDPKNTGDQSIPIVRGGAWTSSAESCRAAKRYGNLPAAKNFYYGFRVVLEP